MNNENQAQTGECPNLTPVLTPEEFWGIWRNAKVVFIEDDARPPDAESGDEAWMRLYGKPRGHTLPSVIHDYGDTILYKYDNRIYCNSYIGSEIREISDELNPNTKATDVSANCIKCGKNSRACSCHSEPQTEPKNSWKRGELAVCDHDECPENQCNRLSGRAFITENDRRIINEKIDQVMPNVPESETPRTDAIWRKYLTRFDTHIGSIDTANALKKNSEQLETELRQKTEELKFAEEALREIDERGWPSSDFQARDALQKLEAMRKEK